MGILELIRSLPSNHRRSADPQPIISDEQEGDIPAEETPTPPQEVFHPCGNIEIKLPLDHLLPRYQAEHTLYDRFLPVLAEQMPPGSWVIDVGANVGDTYVSMASRNPALQFICFEPEPVFFELLEQNTGTFMASGSQGQLPRLFKRLVGRTTIEGRLVSRHGTACVSTEVAALSEHSDNAGVDGAYLSLDTVLTDLEECGDLRSDTFLLVKSDVDGWDFNVIRSLEHWLDRDRLLIQFECQTKTQLQFDAYVALFGELGRQPFKFTVFDNFGNLLEQSGSSQSVISYLHYVWRQEQGIGTRTIWYIDVLVESPSTADICARTMAAYEVEGRQRAQLANGQGDSEVPSNGG